MKSLLTVSLILTATLSSCSSSNSGGFKSEKEVIVQEMVTEVLDQKDWESKLAQEDNPQVIDVRTPEEVAQGKLEGSKNFDFYSPDFIENINVLDKKRPVYVYCRSGGRSAKACKLMEDAGFEALYDLKGGYSGMTH